MNSKMGIFQTTSALLGTCMIAAIGSRGSKLHNLITTHHPSFDPARESRGDACTTTPPQPGKWGRSQIGGRKMSQFVGLTVTCSPSDAVAET